MANWRESAKNILDSTGYVAPTPPTSNPSKSVTTSKTPTTSTKTTGSWRESAKNILDSRGYVPPEKRSYELKLNNGKNFGVVSYDAFNAINSNNLEHYLPKNEEEKKVIDSFKKYAEEQKKQERFPLEIEVDGKNKNFGNISYNAYKAIENNTLDNYKPVDDAEKKAIESYKKFAEEYAKEQREPENLGQGLLHGLGYTLGKFGAGALDFGLDISDYALALGATALRPFTWGSANEAVQNFAEERLNAPTFGDAWSESVESRYRVPDWYRQNIGTTAQAAGNLAVPIAVEYFTKGLAPTEGYTAAQLAKIATTASNATNASKISSFAKMLVKPTVSELAFGLGATASGTKEGYAISGDVGKAFNYGILTGLGEMATEKLFGGIAGTGIGVDELIDVQKYASKIPKIGKLASTKYGKKVLDIAFEGVEEMIMADANPVFQRITGVNPNAESATWKERGESFFQGILLSSVMNASTYAIGKGIDTSNKVKAIKTLNKSAEKLNAELPSEVTKFEPLKLTATKAQIEERNSEIQRIDAINNINSVISEINALFKNDESKLEPLKYDSTIEEIKQRQNEMSVFATTYADLMVDELTKNNPEKFKDIEVPTAEESSVVAEPVATEQRNIFTGELDEIASTEMPTVSVGDTFIDTSTNNILKVVGRDESNTTIEITKPSGEKETKTHPNHGADTLAVNDKYKKVETSTTTPAENVAVAENTTTTPRVNVGEVYKHKENGTTYTIVSRDDKNTTYTVQYSSGHISTSTADNATADLMFDDDSLQKIQAGNTATATNTGENASVSGDTTTMSKEKSSIGKTATEGEIAVVVDAMNDTLVPGAKEAIYESMPPNIDKSLDVFADLLIGAYTKHHTIGHIADYFSDGGKKVIEAIESTLDTATEKTSASDKNTVEKLDNLTDNENELINAFNVLTNAITKWNQQSGDTARQFFHKVLDGQMSDNKDIQSALKALGLMSDDKPKFNIPAKGSSNSGIAIGDELVYYTVPKEYAGNIYELMEKHNKAYELGANIPRIIAVYEGDSTCFLLQTKARGNHFGIERVDTGVWDANDEQIDKLLHTFETIEKVGLVADLIGDNILYDEDNGFTVIDLANEKRADMYDSATAKEMCREFEAFLESAKPFNTRADSKKHSLIERFEKRADLLSERRMVNADAESNLYNENSQKPLKNQSKSATIEEKNIKAVPGADKSHTVAYTNDNERVDLSFKVISVDDLVVSNSLDGKLNPDYPQELQPRDRSRTSSQSQIRQMANSLNPARLAESTSVSEGSPIVGADNVVESGNGRTLAIKLAYEIGTADEYRNHIISNADKYGIDVSNLPEKPILVRERLTEVDRTEFTRKANESSISSLSATEQAKVDAENLTEDVLNLLVANEKGIINTSDNKSFISAVLSKVFKNEDLNNVVNAEGNLSTRGLERIKNAIFYKAYGDASLSARLSESLDNDMKNATTVLLNVAPKVVVIKNGIASEAMYDFDFSKDIANAIRLFEKCRNNNMSIEDYAMQTSMFDVESPLTMAMAYVFETKNRGAKQATDFYNILLDTVIELGNPNQISLDIFEVFQTKEEILDATFDKFNTGVVAENTARGIEPREKNTIIPPESVYKSASEKGRENDRRGKDEVSGNESNENEKTKNAVGVQQDNRRSEETRVVDNDEQLRQKNESVNGQPEVESVAKEIANEREEKSNEQIGSNSLSENGRRGHNGSTRKQTGRISYFERRNKGKNATERQSFARELIERGQVEEVTQKIGKHTYKYTLVKSEAFNDDMLSMVEEARSKGIELGFFIGNAKVNFDSKNNFVVDGIKISDSQILVQYNDELSPQKIFKHEIVHAKWKTRAIQKIKNTILDNLSESDINTILSQERYKRYMKIYKDNKDIVLEEFVCDVMAGMNEYTNNYIGTVVDYWYGSEAVDNYKVSEYTESIDAGGENTGRYSLNWHTDLNQVQYKKVEKWIRQAGNSDDTKITDTANWYKGRINGNDLFVIYSNEDSAPTILYEIQGANAKLEQNILLDLLEVIGNGKSVNGKPNFVSRVSKGSWVQNINNNQNNIGNLGSGQNNQNVGILQGQSQSNGSRAFWNVLENLFKGQEQSVRFSLKDSDGNTLTEAQQEYFKDSKVKDENGNLLVMYQGSANDFTVFDRKKSSYANLYGRGFYFTNSENHASQYGNTRAYYLNIKNPVSTTETTITESQLRKFLQAVIENEDYSFENYGYGATVDSVLKSTYGKSDFLMLNDVSQTAIGDLVETIELFNEVNGTDYDGIMLATETVTFNSEQAKLTSNENPTSNPDIRFSLTQPVEETKNLVAVHNMQVSELERTLDLGGLPMPSIAIIKAQSGHNEYGDVSLVFDKQTIDPKANKNNKVYGGDAWTPTYPTIEYKPNEKIANKISDKYYELSSKFGYDESRPLYNYVYDLERKLNSNKGETEMINELYDDTQMMQLYLLDSGKNKVETIKREIRTELTDAEVERNEFFIKELGVDVVDEVMFNGNGSPLSYRKNYMSKYEDAIRNAYKKLLSEVYQFSDEQVQNVLDKVKPVDYLNFVRNAYKYRQDGRVTTKTEDDREATNKAIRETAGEDYRKWVDSLFKGVEEKSGIRNNADYFTNNGNRRSWEALHWENNLENVVKVMKSQNDVGSAAIFTGHGIWGVSAKNYGSVAEIKADADRLTKLPEEEYNKIKESFGERLHEIAYSIMSKSERNPLIAEDNAMECIIDAVRKSKTKSGILKNLKEYQQLTVTETTVDDIISLVNDISNMPTEYFEAKPQRAVELNEIATAIIPDSTSETTKARLDDIGVKYLEYETGNENARLEALNSLENVRFSLSDEDATYMDAVKNGDTETAQKMVDDVANDAGYAIKAYHGTPNNDFTVFDKNRVGKGTDQYGAGFYFASNTDAARAYGARIIDSRLRLEKPLKVNGSSENGANLIDAGFDYLLTEEQAYEVIKRLPNIYDSEESPLGDYYDSYWESGAEDWMIEELATNEFNRNIGYLDSDLFRNYPNELHEALRAVVGYDGVEVTFENGDKFYVAWFDNQMKSGEPVTYDNKGNIIPLSERFNFDNNDIRYSLATDGILDLEDLWEEAKTKYGTIPKGEIPTRDVDVPKKISEKDVVSRFARTMIEAGVTPDETVSEFEKAILDGTMTHEVITDKKVSAWAKKQIEYHGFEGALKQWSGYSETGGVGKNELALGMELYNQCITNKDVHNAMKIAAELVAEATRAGQTLQATRMLKRMTPDGQLYYLEKSVQKMNEGFKEKLGDKYKDIEVDESLMEEFLTQSDETKRNEAYDKICQNIADQIPATFRDKWNSWRYLAMLGNLRTHLRNIFGNAVFIPSLRLKNYVGAVIEKGAKVKTSDRTKSLRKSKEAVAFAKKDVEEMLKVLQGENAKYAVTSDIQGKRTIFNTKWLEYLRLKNFDFLEKEDMWFLKMHYIDALARLITIRNIDVNSITPQMLEKVRAYAVKEAQAATYRDANALAEGLNRLQKNIELSDKKAIRASGILLEGVMPFKKTPMNIAKQGLNYSPLGILKGVYKSFTQLKKGDTTITEVIDDISKGLSGTMVMLLGYFLASMGWLGGDEDKSKKEKEFDKMVGEQSYALKVGDIFSYTIDWMTPSNLSLFIGAELYDLTKDDFEFADVVGALSTVTEPLLELSVFSGVNGVIESAQYSDSEALLAIGSDMITSYLMQALPTIGGQISRIVDKSKREYYYTDKNSNIPQGLQRFIGQASSKIPFASFLFQPAIDEWGREETYGNGVERVLENTVSPGYYSANNYTDVDKELRELHERTGDDSVLPVIQQKKYTEDYVTYYMSAEDYTETKKIRGQKSFELVSGLLSDNKVYKTQNKPYSRMSDEEKVKAIQKCYEEAGDYTKEKMLEKVKSKSK